MLSFTRVEQALSCWQLYLQALDQSSGSALESGIQERVQGAGAMKQGPKGKRGTYLVLSLWVPSALAAQSLACRVRLEELEWKILSLFSGKGKKNICSHHQSGNLSQ